MKTISVSKTTDELVLHWSERSPVILFENLKLPQFEIENVSTSLCNETFYLGEAKLLFHSFKHCWDRILKRFPRDRSSS